MHTSRRLTEQLFNYSVRRKPPTFDKRSDKRFHTRICPKWDLEVNFHKID